MMRTVYLDLVFLRVPATHGRHAQLHLFVTAQMIAHINSSKSRLALTLFGPLPVQIIVLSCTSFNIQVLFNGVREWLPSRLKEKPVLLRMKFSSAGMDFSKKLVETGQVKLLMLEEAEIFTKHSERGGDTCI